MESHLFIIRKSSSTILVLGVIHRGISLPRNIGANPDDIPTYIGLQHYPPQPASEGDHPDEFEVNGCVSWELALDSVLRNEELDARIHAHFRASISYFDSA
ncbi:hypothetical protein A0H81_13084 [Grifola frondosa]|uniref:Uncharacterized protein n=1 Tax=Grifola frondosa TaxID=5627 RepID=A0A1C7LQ89_GRIFR|nr:hypothetical protein A0H81_13084 [Grifola frondosa]